MVIWGQRGDVALSLHISIEIRQLSFYRGQGHSLVTFTALTMDCEWLRSLRKQRGPRSTLSQSPPLSTEPVREPTLLASKTTVTE